MRRREFITLLGSAAAWPLAAGGQQGAIPVVGYLRAGTALGSEHLIAALRQGLMETGYVDGRNVALEDRWSDNHTERLANLAVDLVHHQVSVIVASTSKAALAAKAATSNIPIVFVIANDPVEAGLIKSINHPGGNATGFTYLTSALGAKRLELLRQLVPSLDSIAVIVRPDNGGTKPLLADVRTAATALGVTVIVSAIDNERDVEDAFARLAQQRLDGLIVGPDPIFTSRRTQIVALAEHYALPAIYTTAEFVRVGGLLSWGVSLTDQHRQAGIYAGKILNGASPSDLPVMQPTKYELVLNLKAATALGLTIPPTLLALADEVIE